VSALKPAGWNCSPQALLWCFASIASVHLNFGTRSAPLAPQSAQHKVLPGHSAPVHHHSRGPANKKAEACIQHRGSGQPELLLITNRATDDRSRATQGSRVRDLGGVMPLPCSLAAACLLAAVLLHCAGGSASDSDGILWSSSVEPCTPCRLAASSSHQPLSALHRSHAPCAGGPPGPACSVLPPVPCRRPAAHPCC
jgi:hypothetical protein